jgi:cysteine desulfurase
MQKNKTYFDYAATTPVDERVLEAMMPYFRDVFGNPSSIHEFGQKAEAAVEQAREKIAGYINCRTDEIIFTSCGSESDNLALRGAAIAARQARNARHILIGSTEHHAVSHTAIQLEKYFGFEVEYLPVDENGIIHPETVASRLRADTAVVSIIYANNEIGSINPISTIGAICRQAGIPFHTDAVQAAAYLTIDAQTLNVDMLSLGAHKFYGPKGVGALYVRNLKTSKGPIPPILPAQTGGGQEFGYRAGTHNVPYIVGIAEALHIAQTNKAERSSKLIEMRDHLIGQVLEAIPDVRLTGHPVDRLPNHASFVFKEVDGNQLLMLLDIAGFACSSGSACKTGSPEPSEVLIALGLPRQWALGSLRVTSGIDTNPNDIESLVKVLPELIDQARSQQGTGAL